MNVLNERSKQFAEDSWIIHRYFTGGDETWCQLDKDCIRPTERNEGVAQRVLANVYERTEMVQPHITCDAQGTYCFEWWKADRKISLYVDYDNWHSCPRMHLLLSAKSGRIVEPPYTVKKLQEAHKWLNGGDEYYGQ